MNAFDTGYGPHKRKFFNCVKASDQSIDRTARQIYEYTYDVIISNMFHIITYSYVHRMQRKRFDSVGIVLIYLKEDLLIKNG